MSCGLVRRGPWFLYLPTGLSDDAYVSAAAAPFVFFCRYRRRDRAGEWAQSLAHGGIFVAFTAMMFGNAYAQGTVERRVKLSETENCPSCVVRVARPVPLQDARGDLRSAVITRSNRSVASFISPDLAPWVFDTLGRVIRRLAVNSGPQRGFGGPTIVGLFPGDTIGVFDNHTYRMHFFSPDGRLIRSINVDPIGSVSSIVSVGQGKWVVQASMQTPTTVGLPLHLMSEAGHLMKSFGSVDGSYRWDAGIPSDRRRIGAGPKGSIWMTPWDKYQLELWTASDVASIQYSRAPDWFYSPKYLTVPSSTSKSRSYISDIWASPSGPVWLVCITAVRNWQTATPFDSLRSEDGSVHEMPREADKLFESVITMIDPSNDGIVLERRFPMTIDRLLNDNWALALSFRDGHWLHTLWRIDSNARGVGK
jgi:hypothetical protein